ncbi:uncharacterized protein LOC109794221 [Cajanus cajan]|uniref:uncharacterized protein LOC109794221 n=1 Tax=Cajanus cajan TaxID=3821 RepID=UPI00098DA87B|nr:uncharacterized protein LOC109794221 [Cajanus cajan]
MANEVGGFRIKAISMELTWTGIRLKEFQPSCFEKVSIVLRNLSCLIMTVSVKHRLKTINLSKWCDQYTFLFIEIFKHFHHIILMYNFIWSIFIPIRSPVSIESPDFSLPRKDVKNSSGAFCPPYLE